MFTNREARHSVTIGKYVSGVIALLVLASCRMVIITDSTGHIVSSSGQYDCEKSRCVSRVEEPITESFTPVPAEGYRFVRWKGLCTFSVSEVCKATVAPLADEYSHLDGDILLFAEFEPTSTIRTWFGDNDNDGYGASDNTITSSSRPQGYVVNQKDCDDTNSRIRPWAKEVEDGVDNNCNGEIDEGFVDRTYYLDSDGDGYGDPNAEVTARQQPQGYVSNALDCNDSFSEDNPDASEQLDSRDNNCDGRIDENARTYYRDLDGDGYGLVNTSIESFEPVAGYALNAGDCDDNNNNISPAAREEYDGVDNDCDQLVDEGFSPRTYFLDADSDGYGDNFHSLLAVESPIGYVLNGTDNCPEHYNPDQADIDSDGAGDACDPIDDRSPTDEPDPADESDPVEEAEPVVDDVIGDGSCTVSPQAKSMLDAVNAFRAGTRTCGSQGSFSAVPALSWSCELETAALAHSADMANNNFFSHTGSDGSSAGDRATRAGYSWSAWGENIAAGGGYDSVNAVLQGWINSPGHCANLMSASVTNLGAARYTSATSSYGIYWTQVFGRPR